jgi:hypothetical protein
MLYGKELVESIRKRCEIQPGMLVVSLAAGENEIPKVAVVMEVSPACEFDRDYEGAEGDIFYKCQPADGTPVFVDYAQNLREYS